MFYKKIDDFSSNLIVLTTRVKIQFALSLHKIVESSNPWHSNLFICIPPCIYDPVMLW